MYVKRIIPLLQTLRRKSVLLLGPRQTGKSTLIAHEVKADRVYNLLLADVFRKLSNQPELIRKELKGKEKLIVIDEIQKLPVLMDEVHAMIEQYKLKFLLTGSSARKLKRTHTSLMAGRAKPMYLMPLTSSEIGISKLNIQKVLTFGSLPPVYLADDPWDELKTYAGTYLMEEIKAEALARKVEQFSRFFHTAALWNGELINFDSVANDAQVPPRTIREYYEILKDTLIIYELIPLQKQGKRKAISTSKFYFFDIGVANSLTGQKLIAKDTHQYGKAFEHFIFLELKAYINYFRSDASLHFWRTYQGNEVDFIINQEISIEVKATHRAHERHTKGLSAISQEFKMKRKILISKDESYQKINDVEVYPYQEFLDLLWSGDIF